MNRVKVALKKFYYGKYRFINGGRGVISLFLALLMMPFLSIAAVFIDVARVNSAISIFDEALCNASDSTLGTYEDFLRERFGLYAMSQDIASQTGTNPTYSIQDAINDTFIYYLKENTAVLPNAYYDFEDESGADGVYPLSDNNVLAYQVNEFSKYTIPIKIAEDVFDVEDILKEIETKIFTEDGVNGLKEFTAANEAVGDMVIVAKAIDVLQDSVVEEDKKHSEFCTSLSKYVEVAKAYNDEVREWSQKVSPLESELSTLRAKRIDGVEDEELESSISALESAISNIDNEYENKISGKRNAVKSNAEVMAKVTQELKESIEKSLQDKGLADEAMNDLMEANKDLFDTIVDIKHDDNIGVIAKAGNEVFVNQVNGIKKEMDKVDDQYYENAKTNLDGYIAIFEKSKSISGRTYCGTVNEQYGAQFLYSENYIIEMMENYSNQIKSESNLSFLKVIVDFIDVLFKTEGLIDMKYSATIDRQYYRDSMSGLPSEKTNTKNEFAEKDKELAARYSAEIFDQEMFNKKGLDLNNFGASDAIKIIAENIHVIKCHVDFLTGNGNGNALSFIISNTVGIPIRFAMLLTHFKEICDCISNIIDQITVFVEYIKNLFENLGTVIKSKTLMAGYITYMTSNRTSKEDDESLTGMKFSAVGAKEKTVGETVSSMLNIVKNLVKSSSKSFWSSECNIVNIQELISGSFVSYTEYSGSDKAFVAAETEYVICGNDSEILNQGETFLKLVILRAVLDIFPIVNNKEVRAIAAATGPWSFLVYILYFVLEPLIDVMLLAGGEEIQIWRTTSDSTATAYLTPTGIPKLITLITDLKLYDENGDILKCANSVEDILNTFGNIGKNDNDGGSDVDFNSMNYQKAMFLFLIFVPYRDMVERLGDIIQMEATQYYEDNGKGEFDLDKSYTYIRAHGKFKMHEFLPVSDKLNGDFILGKERIVYRGY